MGRCAIARRYRNQAGAGLEDLLALSGKFRRAATVRFWRSANVQQVTFLWPTPHRIADGSGQSIGYAGGVVLPLQVQGKGCRTKPVTLRLKSTTRSARNCACRRTGAPRCCRLPRLDIQQRRPLAAAEARVPKPAPVGERAALAVRSVPRGAGAALRASSSTWPHPPRANPSICSPKGRARNGLYRSPHARRRRSARPAALCLRSRRPAAGREPARRDRDLDVTAGDGLAIEVKTRLD